ncbi:MAG: hypothetical protein U7127_23555 [Phormidium sp.]
MLGAFHFGKLVIFKKSKTYVLWLLWGMILQNRDNPVFRKLSQKQSPKLTTEEFESEELTETELSAIAGGITYVGSINRAQQSYYITPPN